MSASTSNIGTIYKIVDDQDMRKFRVDMQGMLSGLLIVSGTYYCVKACSDIRSNKISSGLRKGCMGAIALAHGIYNLISTWQEVVVDPNTIHCHKWSNGDYTISMCKTPDFKVHNS